MNDLKNARDNHAELDRPVVDALAGLLNTAPPAADRPTDAALLDDHRANGSGRSRIVVAVAASAVVALGAGGLILLQPQSDIGISDSVPNPDLSTPAASESTMLPAPQDVADELGGLYLPTELPAGYQFVGAAARPPSDAPFDTAADDTAPAPSNSASSILTALPAPGQPGGFISADIIANVNNDTIDTFDTYRGYGELSDYERQTVGGIERLVQIQPVDDLGPFTVVTWPSGDVIITVTGRAEPSDVIAFAESMAPASIAEFRTAGEQITVEAQALEVFDQTTFADGISVSLRSVDVASGPIAMCIDAPITRCTYLLSETGLGGAYQNSLTDAFDVNGETRFIAWHDTAEAQRLGEPTLEATMTAPVDEDVDQAASDNEAQTGSSITQTVTTNLGQFIEIVVPAGEAPPSITYQTPDGTLITIEAQPPSPLAF